MLECLYNIRRLSFLMIVLISLMIIAGCGSTSGSSEDENLADGGTTIIGNPVAGYVQKGPFIIGSSISIQELAGDTFLPTGLIYETQTTDSLGSFSTQSEINTQYIEVRAEGHYYNEVTGKTCDAELALGSIADIWENEDVNVNVLTTLEKERIIYLINEGKTFTEARLQAETEVLKIFHIPEEEIEKANNFDEMDIVEEGNSNAILLAISVVLQGSNTVPKLIILLSEISEDISEDGTLDNGDILDALRENAMNLDADDLQTIRSNLKERYESMGPTITVPPFEDYMDSDGDGIINKYE